MEVLLVPDDDVLAAVVGEGIKKAVAPLWPERNAEQDRILVMLVLTLPLPTRLRIHLLITRKTRRETETKKRSWMFVRSTSFFETT